MLKIILTDWKRIGNHLVQLLMALQLGNIISRIWEYHWLSSDPISYDMFVEILKQYVFFGLTLVAGLTISLILTMTKKNLASLISGLIILTYVSYKFWTY